MLKAIDVKGLFGLYSYQLDFTNTEGTALKFITGPNGYGKTTLLSFIWALYKCRFDVFWTIPFDLICFVFDKEVIEIIRNKSEKTVDESSDESGEMTEKLVLRFYNNQSPQDVEEMVMDNTEAGMDVIGRNLRIYLSSLSCYYIKDRRLEHESMAGRKEIAAVEDNAADLRELLTRQRSELSEALRVSNLVFSSSISEEEYNRRKGSLLPMLEKCKVFGLLDDSLVLNDYVAENSVFLHAFLVAVENAVEKIRPFIERLETFFNIISRSHFVDKQMEIHPRYGYRFVLENPLHPILPLTALSSGEQHVLILSYELLFKASDEALVLIDEPEISLHLLWQMDFLINLKSIMNLRKIQAIVATHSPQIFNQDWALTVDLYRQSKEGMN